ncbi:uncharacterized protein LOC135210375 [Macrobrachium nipponense]|uniref:uncharacterized protein LOC135210375 n=1 Tax=Macrobrachium nipponense TaxID=159736 RepID=UPI0030C830A6
MEQKIKELEEIIEQQQTMLVKLTGKLQELLLRERNLNLAKAVEICLAYEATVNCAKEMCEVGSENVNKAVCKKAVKIVQEKNEEADEGYDHYMWMAPVAMKNSNRLTALLIVNDTEVRFHLDTGADVNAICQRYVKRDQVRPTSVKLAKWNKSKLSPIGETTLNVKNPKNDEIRSVTFIVVSNDLMCLLGSKTCQEVGFVFVNGKAFVSKIDVDHEMSDLGDLGKVKINVDSTLPTRILPCRRLPIALKSKVLKELHSLVKRGVLISETEPTEWVSQMAVVQKTNGKLRIGIDPQPLNKALKREYYKLPILEDILPSLKHAKIFSKLDVQEAFWHIRLDEESSKLTTMITPFGRYRWARLPFRLKVSSEIFQRKLNEALEGLRGVYCVADDIVVVGFGNEENKVDSSKDGIGAVIMQEGRPIEYASRTLARNERNWAQIEKEVLAVVFGLERLEQYTFGRRVIVHNDHKPLSSILEKPFSQAPVRLQVLMMRLNR